MATIHLEVVTPQGAIVSEDVVQVCAKGDGGDFCALANHAPFLSTIKPGALSYMVDNNRHNLMVSQGFSEVSENKITFLVESGEKAEKIDVERAKAAKERAERRLAEAKQREDINTARAMAALQRALARIKAAQNV
ncbi:MAG: F0F1 ATP synthase subunit epsilon [Thermodesulfobacteriota bacterium]